MANDVDAFLDLLLQSPTINTILERSNQLQIPNWYFGAGCLAQTVWNLNSGNPPNRFINDIDWVYFDGSDLSAEKEIQTEKRVREHFVDIPLKFDVKNQARVHQWYAHKFGYEIAPYKTIEDAIRTWPTTVTAIAITKSAGQTKVFAPFGVTDLMSMTVRANKAQITEEIFLAKVERWKQCWPSLSIVGWNSAE